MKLDGLKDIDAPILEWLEFIDEKSKEGMEMLAEKNENIKTAYEILQRVSKSKEARMAYEARQAEIMDQLTREKSALLMNLPMDQIEKLTALSIETIKGLKN